MLPISSGRKVSMVSVVGLDWINTFLPYVMRPISSGSKFSRVGVGE